MGRCALINKYEYNRKDIDIDYMKKNVYYCEDTKSLKYTDTYCNMPYHKNTTDIGGSKYKNGYVSVSINGTKYLYHRLVYLLKTGSLPPKNYDIDHINGDRSDNRFENLRAVTRSENNFNQRLASKNNKSGYLGVSLHRSSGLFRATIFVEYKQKCIGYFKTAEEAYTAYLKCKREIHNTCTI